MLHARSILQAGLVQFTRSIGEGLAARGVRLAALCPQFVDTPFVAHYNRDGALPLLTPARVRGAFPLHRLKATGTLILSADAPNPNRRKGFAHEVLIITGPRLWRPPSCCWRMRARSGRWSWCTSTGACTSGPPRPRATSESSAPRPHPLEVGMRSLRWIAHVAELVLEAHCLSRLNVPWIPPTCSTKVPSAKVQGPRCLYAHRLMLHPGSQIS